MSKVNPASVLSKNSMTSGRFDSERCSGANEVWERRGKVWCDEDE